MQLGDDHLVAFASQRLQLSRRANLLHQFGEQLLYERRYGDSDRLEQVASYDRSTIHDETFRQAEGRVRIESRVENLQLCSFRKLQRPSFVGWLCYVRSA